MNQVKNNMFSYKGHYATVEFDVGKMTLRGTIHGLKDRVVFESKDADDIEATFHKALDEYLDKCKEAGKNPDKEYKGSLNIRIPPELHKKMIILAAHDGISLNSMVEKAMQAYIRDKI